MRILVVSFLVAVVAVLSPLGAVALDQNDGVVEFGEVRNVQSKKSSQKKDDVNPWLLRSKTETHRRQLLKEDGPFWDNLSSMSYDSPTTAPVAVYPTVAPVPEYPTTVAPVTKQPSSMPIVVGLPTPSPTNQGSDVPSQTPSLIGVLPPPSSPTKHDPTHRHTKAPSSAPTSTGTSVTDEVVFKCSNNNVVIIAKPPAKTTINFNVGYWVQTSAVLDDYVTDLEALILEVATIGALQCGKGGPLFGNKGTPPQVPMFTSVTGDKTCPSQDNSTAPTPSSGSVCTILETNFQILIKENMDPDLAAFLGYHNVQVAMDNGNFTKAIPVLDRIEYLSPLPLVPPTNTPAPAPLDSESSQLSVSRWTIGAAVAMGLGGTIALGAWARKRRTRNQRHLQLMEETSSMASPSPPEQAASPQE